MINAAVYFMEKEHVLEAPLHFQFVLGVNGMAKATPEVVTAPVSAAVIIVFAIILYLLFFLLSLCIALK